MIKLKRFLSTLLALLMVISLIPLSSITANATDNTAWYDARVNQTLANISSDNYNSSNPFSKGQCTWYCFGRALEKCGVYLPAWKSNGTYGNADEWYDNAAAKGFSVGYEVRSNSIACFSGMHVIFIEWVDGETVYYTEANKDSNGTYNSGVDCILVKSTITKLRQRLNSTYQGCIYLDDGGSVTTEPTPVNLGESFTAPILNKRHWKIIENNNGIVQTANETGKSNQLWKFERQSDGSYKISSCLDGRCLDVANASSAPEAQVWVVDSNDSSAQRWFIYEESDGYVLKAKCTNCVLDLPNNDPTNGNQLHMYTQNGTGAQIWAIYDGDECKLTAPTLTVTSGTATAKTTFTWDNIYGETGYDVKIWKGTAFEGDAYHIEWDAVSGWGIQLPAGTYQAYVDASNYYETKRSNIVTFYIEESEYTVTYDANGGTGAPSAQTKQHDVGLTLSTTLPEYFPYNFMGWESSQGRTYEPGDVYTKNESTTMTAEWGSPDDIEMDYHDGYGLNYAPIPWGGYSWTYYFSPEISTYYRFMGDDDEDNMIILRDEAGNILATDDDSGGNRQFELEYYLEADELYFITVKKYSSSQTGDVVFVTFSGFNVTYDANGGKNAPAPARWYIDEGYMFSHDMPTRVGYTFLGWSLKADATEPEFYPGEDFDIPMDVTLYAVWSPLPYLFYGDLNQDRTVTLTDVNIISKYLNGTYTPAYDAKEFLLRADLDHNGVITENDKKLINDIKLAQLTQEEIEAGCIDVRISALPETEYVLGQEYDTGGLTLLLDFGTHAYPITEDLSVSGYNPGALGEQKITVTFYQYSASYTITVHPEEAPILYGDVNGDGNVNTKDRMVLTRYLAGMTGYTADMIDMKAADVNCDGTVNAKDRMILTRYLAQWTAYPELPHRA